MVFTNHLIFYVLTNEQISSPVIWIFVKSLLATQAKKPILPSC